MTDHPSALVSVPVEPTEAMLAAVSPINGRRVWSAMIAAAPAAPQAAGVGDCLRPEVRAFAQLMEDKLRANDWKGGWKSDFSGDLLRRAHEELGELDDEMASGNPDMFDNSAIANEAADVANMLMMVVDVCGALPALRAPSREPEGGAVTREQIMAVVRQYAAPAWCSVDRMADALAAIMSPALATDPCASHKAEGVSLDPCCPTCEAPAEAGERDYPAEFEAWWSSYRHRNRDVADYPVKKQIAFDAFYFGARAQPQAREDAQPVAVCDGVEQPAFEEWASKQGLDMHEHPLHYLFLDAKTDAARQAWKAGLEHAVGRMATHPAPDAQPVGWLRAADEEIVCAHLGVAEAEDSYETAKKKLASLIQWNIAVAMDPSVGGHSAPDALRVAVEAAGFLLDRLEDLEQDVNERDFYGHVHPAASRLRKALAALQAEQKGGA